MATEEAYIERVRRRVHDVVPDAPGAPVYPDVYYQDGLRNGLARLNLDLQQTYTTAEAVPPPNDYLLELRAAIYMCQIRAGEGAVGTPGRDSMPSGPQIEIEVPNLRVEHAPYSLQGPEFWNELLDDLADEYDELLEGVDPNAGVPTVTVSTASRLSLRTMRFTARQLDSPPPVSGLSASVASGAVTLSWTNWQSMRFVRYEIWRSSFADMSTAERVAVVSDNHIVSHTDMPAPGTWHYQLHTLNTSALSSASPIVSVVV